jgi:hypothetical protein
VLGAMFSAGALPFKTTRYSLTRYSPFAIRCRFGLAGALPSLKNLPKFLTAEGGEGDARFSVGTLGTVH